MNCGERVEVKVIFAVKLQTKPREKPEASMGFEPMTSAYLINVLVYAAFKIPTLSLINQTSRDLLVFPGFMGHPLALLFRVSLTQYLLLTH